MSPLLTQIHSVPGGKIFQITMNRPDVHNCVNGEMAGLFLNAWKTFATDPTLTVCVLHGAGEKSFCSGADLSALGELANINANEKEISEYVENGTGPLGGSRILQEKPVITVSHGYTYAGGLELFCHGHIRVAEKQAMFSVACRRWGVPLVDGGTVYLPRLLGYAGALPLIITGQRIRADRAHAIGLVWEVTPKGKGLERAMSIATQVCAQPRDAMFADLKSALQGYHLPIDEALKIEAANLHPVMKSESTKDGINKFLKGERFWSR